MSRIEFRDPKIERELRLLRNIIPIEMIERKVTTTSNEIVVYDRIAFHNSLVQAGLIDRWRKEFADRRTNSATPEGNDAQAN